MQISQQPYPFTGNSAKTKIIDSSGNEINSSLDIAGARHLSVDTIQTAIPVAANSSTSNLNSGATFTGTSTSTLGVVGIQVSLKTDVNCTVYIEQSPDGTNWDLTDTYYYYNYANNFGITVQAINSYFRVKVTNTSSSNSTYFRLQSVLCPMVEAVPRSLDANGFFKTSVNRIYDTYGFESENTPGGEMRVVIPLKLVGATFVGNTIDTNFWTVTNANGGTGTLVDSVLTLNTNTTANGSTIVNSARTARFVSGTSHLFHSGTRFTTAGTANNTRRFGVFTATDGYFFQLSGTTFSIVVRKNSADTVVSNGSFNGSLGTSITVDTNFHTYEIYYDLHCIYFVYDDKPLHIINVSTSSFTANPNFQSRFENVNSGGSTSNVRMESLDGNIYRLGQIQTAPANYHTTGAGTYTLKSEPGLLHTININGAGPVGSTLTIYDNTAGSGKVIGIIDVAKIAGPVSLPYNGGLNFDIGLTLVQVGTFDSTIIYE